LFQAFHTNNSERIVALAKANGLLSRVSEALLCFAHCSRDLVALKNATLPTFVSNSLLALSYYNALAALARKFEISSVDTQRLLGFEPMRSNDNANTKEGGLPAVSELWLFSSSILFGSVRSIVKNAEPTSFALGLSAVIVSESDIARLVAKTIPEKLKSEIQSMHKMANAARYIQPCLDFAIFGNCKIQCGRHELNSFKLVDEVRQTHFNDRLRAHILQILIVNAYQAQAASEYQAYKW
jgi:hypothetical protein